MADTDNPRVNYFIKSFLITEGRKFAPTLQCFAHPRNPNIVCHPVIVLLSDLVWGRVASRSFLKERYLFTLMIFIVCQSILQHVTSDNK